MTSIYTILITFWKISCHLCTVIYPWLNENNYDSNVIDHALFLLPSVHGLFEKKLNSPLCVSPLVERVGYYSCDLVVRDAVPQPV